MLKKLESKLKKVETKLRLTNTILENKNHIKGMFLIHTNEKKKLLNKMDYIIYLQRFLFFKRKTTAFLGFYEYSNINNNKKKGIMLSYFKIMSRIVRIKSCCGIFSKKCCLFKISEWF